MIDKHVVKIDPFFFGDQVEKILFDLIGIPLLAQTQSLGKPLDMGIDGDPFGFFESAGKHDVGSLSRHTRDTNKFLEVPGR